jgi:rubrerythrin
MVKEVIEHITGKEVDVEAAIAAESANPTAKGAALLAKYEAQNDPLALAAYQFIAEGRAERVWNKMAECIQDEFISTTYAKIAKDEKFHASIGRRQLMQLCEDPVAQQQIMEVADAMRKDLFLITCAKSGMSPESKAIMENAYGSL